MWVDRIIGYCNKDMIPWAAVLFRLNLKEDLIYHRMCRSLFVWPHPILMTAGESPHAHSSWNVTIGSLRPNKPIIFIFNHSSLKLKTWWWSVSTGIRLINVYQWHSSNWSTVVGLCVAKLCCAAFCGFSVWPTFPAWLDGAVANVAVGGPCWFLLEQYVNSSSMSSIHTHRPTCSLMYRPSLSSRYNMKLRIPVEALM